MEETPFMHLCNNLDSARFVGPDDLVKTFKETFNKVLKRMDAYFLEHDYYSIVDYGAIVEQILNSDGYYRFCVDNTLKKIPSLGKCYFPSENGSYILLYEYTLNNPTYRETVLCHEFIHMLSRSFKQKLVLKKGEKKIINTKFLLKENYGSVEINNLTKHTFKRDNSENPFFFKLISEGFTELLCNKIYPDAPYTYFGYRKLVHLLNSLTGEENNIQDFLRGEFGDLISIIGKPEFLKILQKSVPLNGAMQEHFDRITEHKEFSDMQLAIVIPALKGIQESPNNFNAKNIINFCGSLGVNASEMLNGFAPRIFTINSLKEMLNDLIEQKTKHNEDSPSKFKELLIYSLFNADKLSKCKYLSLLNADILNYEKNILLEELGLPNTTDSKTYRANIKKAEQRRQELLDECTNLLDNFDCLPYLKIVAKHCGLENVRSIKLLKFEKDKKFLLLDVDGYESIYLPISKDELLVHTKSTTKIGKAVPLYSTKLDEDDLSEVMYNTGEKVNKDSTLITFMDNTKLVEFTDKNNKARFGIPVLPTSDKDSSKILEIESASLYSAENDEIKCLIETEPRENIDNILDTYINRLLTPTETPTEILDATDDLFEKQQKKNTQRITREIAQRTTTSSNNRDNASK